MPVDDAHVGAISIGVHSLWYIVSRWYYLFYALYCRATLPCSPLLRLCAARKYAISCYHYLTYPTLLEQQSLFSRGTEVPARRWPHFSTRRGTHHTPPSLPPTMYTFTTDLITSAPQKYVHSCQAQPHNTPGLQSHPIWHTGCSARHPHTGTPLPRQGTNLVAVPKHRVVPHRYVTVTCPYLYLTI